jgi:histidine decarboxylase
MLLDDPARARRTADRLTAALAGFSERRDQMLGYQWSQQLDGYARLAPFLDFHLDNIGDPFSPSLTALNTKEFEREVLDYFARLWHARGPSDVDDPESYWGYVLSMGSTEGNLYALWNARDYLSGARLLRRTEAGPDREPVLFSSADAHYSLAKGAAMLRIHTLGALGNARYPGRCPTTSDGVWPNAVPSVGGSTGTGRIDAEQLAALVGFFADRGHPPIIVLNLGSTFKGAYDQPEAVWDAVSEPLRRNGMLGGGPDGSTRRGYWLHVDGALGGGCLPYMEMAADQGLLDRAGPRFDFRLPYVSSIVTSGHKWFGTPFPTGVYLSKQRLRVAPPSDPRYIGSPDTTFSGARNGLSSLLLWYALESRGDEERIQSVCGALSLADHLAERLRELEADVGLPLWVARADQALAVRFRRPADRVVAKYGLVGERARVGASEDRDYVHAFLMPHVSKETIDRLIDDLSAPIAYAP